MWYNNKATEMLGIDYPIFQGPFGGGLSTPALVGAVSNNGGLGGYGAYTLTPEEIYLVDSQIKQVTGKPYNLNLWVSDTDAADSELPDEKFAYAQQLLKPYFDELGIPVPAKPAPFTTRFENQVEVILNVRPKVFSFVFGIPSATILDDCRRRGITTAGAATTLDEAIALEAAGVDMIVASGFEAGGHRPSFLKGAEQSLVGTFVLLQLIREKTNIPVVAAGGIATARGIAAAMTLGASAVQVGTAFLATEESGALPVHRQRLFSEASRQTTLTRAFTGRLGRGITSRLTEALQGKENSLLPFPLQSTFMSSLRKEAIAQEQWEFVLFWGGQIAPLLSHSRAADLMLALVSEMGTISLDHL